MVGANSLLGYDKQAPQNACVHNFCLETDIEDLRPNNGRFVQLGGLFMYQGDSIVLFGDLLFRGKRYEGHEFYAHKDVPLGERIDTFVSELVESGAINRRHVRVGPIK
jgi:hypothetical protein